MPCDSNGQTPLPINPYTRANPTVRIVASICRLLLHRWCASVQVHGLDRFLNIIRDEERIKSGRGVLTYANHISV
jgi:monolysocardiolipin acyltransferase